MYNIVMSEQSKIQIKRYKIVSYMRVRRSDGTVVGRPYREATGTLKIRTSKIYDIKIQSERWM